MHLLASFNGGPSNGSLVLAVACACLVGVVAGRYSRGMVWAFLFAFLGTSTACALFLTLGNQQGDAAGVFLVGALLIFCPILGIISGVLAVVARWVIGIINDS
ncbi:MAG TPA: hypothetical protein PLN21_12910 [Gemmatales bacterium]|nr:hypothetical protein [Gemmatales bacterium]